MPVSAYFKGHGTEVMSDMTKRYGAKKGKSVFYATANKQKAGGMAGVLAAHKRKGNFKKRK